MPFYIHLCFFRKKSQVIFAFENIKKFNKKTALNGRPFKLNNQIFI